jgi:hypothetical protein
MRQWWVWGEGKVIRILGDESQTLTLLIKYQHNQHLTFISQLKFTQFDADDEQLINVPEGAVPGDLLYVLEAVDPDEGDFGKASCRHIACNFTTIL